MKQYVRIYTAPGDTAIRHVMFKTTPFNPGQDLREHGPGAVALEVIEIEIETAALLRAPVLLANLEIGPGDTVRFKPTFATADEATVTRSAARRSMSAS